MRRSGRDTAGGSIHRSDGWNSARSASPDQRIVIRYDRRENLVAMGVLPPARTLARARPVPRDARLRTGPLVGLSPIRLAGSARRPVVAGSRRVDTRHTMGAAPATDSDESDETQMLAYAGGSSRAFEQLYARHRGGTYRYLLRHTGKSSDGGGAAPGSVAQRRKGTRQLVCTGAVCDVALHHRAKQARRSLACASRGELGLARR